MKLVHLFVKSLHIFTYEISTCILEIIACIREISYIVYSLFALQLFFNNYSLIFALPSDH